MGANVKVVWLSYLPCESVQYEDSFGYAIECTASNSQKDSRRETWNAISEGL